LIKKLKIKVILMNMILVTSVLLIAFIILYFNTASELEESSITALKDIAHEEQNPMNDFFDRDKPPKNKYQHLTTYVLEIDLFNDTCYINGYGSYEDLTEENLTYINGIIISVINSSSDEGILTEENLRFYRVKTHNGFRVVLLDKQYEDVQLRDFVTYFSAIALFAWAGFFVLSFFLSKLFIKPIEKSIKQQRQFTADVSHELKTPITVISTNTDIILSHSDSTVENEKKWLNYIKDETARMSELVNMMLYLAKNDENVTSHVFKEFNLSNAAYEVALPFESVCFEKGKYFDIEITNDIFIKGDETSIKQLFIILLDNAVKYSNENGTVKLSIYTSGEKAFIDVSNTGEPIPKESIPLLFERFYRVDEARSRDTGGSGLGLSIAKSIIDKNEAEISVISNKQQGTIFSCSFKAVKLKNNTKT